MRQTVPIQALLRGEEDELLLLARLLQRGDGGRALDVEGQEHAREHREAAQGQHGQGEDIVCHFCHGSLLSGDGFSG